MVVVVVVVVVVIVAVLAVLIVESGVGCDAIVLGGEGTNIKRTTGRQSSHPLLSTWHPGWSKLNTQPKIRGHKDQVNIGNCRRGDQSGKNKRPY